MATTGFSQLTSKTINHILKYYSPYLMFDRSYMTDEYLVWYRFPELELEHAYRTQDKKLANTYSEAQCIYKIKGLVTDDKIRDLRSFLERRFRKGLQKPDLNPNGQS